MEKSRRGLVRLSSNFLRNLNTSAAGTASNPSSTTAASTAAAGAGAGAKKKNKKKNLFEVAQFLPNWGIGYHMAKTHWTGLSYQITKLNLYKDGKHGKAWGIVHKEGLPPAEAPRKISGVHKRCWRYIPNLHKPEEGTRTPETQAPETQAA